MFNHCLLFQDCGVEDGNGSTTAGERRCFMMILQAIRQREAGKIPCGRAASFGDEAFKGNLCGVDPDGSDALKSFLKMDWCKILQNW